MTKNLTKKRPRKLRCANCKKFFVVPKRGRPPLYCSGSCRQLAYQKRRWRLPTLMDALNKDLADVAKRRVKTETLASLLDSTGKPGPGLN